MLYDHSYSSALKFGAAWRLIWADRPVAVACVVLLCSVGTLLILNIVLDELRGPGDEWESLPAKILGVVHIAKDGSIAENFGHGMAFAAAILFFVAATAAKSRTCMAMSGVMAITWFDDSARYHERMGEVFSASMPGLRLAGIDAHTFGELFAWLTIGVAFALLAFWASRTYGKGDRMVLRLIAAPMLLLIACASIIDVVHAFLSDTPFGFFLAYLEDGGEMVAIALLAIVALYLSRNAGQIANP